MKKRKTQAGLAGKKQAGASSAAEVSMAELERVLGHQFARPELLALALTHRSYVYDSALTSPESDLADPARDNEQLEFVGDAALGLLAAESLCRRFPASREGELDAAKGFDCEPEESRVRLGLGWTWGGGCGWGIRRRRMKDGGMRHCLPMRLRP